MNTIDKLINEIREKEQAAFKYMINDDEVSEKEFAEYISNKFKEEK